MVVASSQVLPPWWNSGATASVKALENLGTRPGQLWATGLGGRTGLLSFSFTLVPRVSEVDHFRMSELLQSGIRSPRPEEVGPEERHLWKRVWVMGLSLEGLLWSSSGCSGAPMGGPYSGLRLPQLSTLGTRPSFWGSHGEIPQTGQVS